MARVCVPPVNKTRCGATGTPAATVRTTDAAPLRRLGSLPLVHLTSFQHLALPATRGALAALAAWAAWAAGLADPAPAPGPAPPPVLRSESGRHSKRAHPTPRNASGACFTGPKVYPCDTKHACIHPDEREQREAATEHAYREGCSSCRTGRAAARMGQQRSTSLRNYAATIT